MRLFIDKYVKKSHHIIMIYREVIMSGAALAILAMIVQYEIDMQKAERRTTISDAR